MKMTSAEANKMLRQLNAERGALLAKEEKSCTFLAVMGEDPDTVRPAYDYDGVQDALREMDWKIRVLKHGIFMFNMNTTVPEFDMTIDELLIYLPQLTARVSKFEQMAARLPKEREQSAFRGPSNFVDYRYANYDIDKAEADYKEASDMLALAQTALDKLNSTLEFEVEL
ncbi:MAG: hypothetical protein KBS66_02815 [Eubacterium sp.]|nr:hypothetical protein [Candidatus Colimonas fimequi]